MRTMKRVALFAVLTTAVMLAFLVSLLKKPLPFGHGQLVGCPHSTAREFDYCW